MIKFFKVNYLINLIKITAMLKRKMNKTNKNYKNSKSNILKKLAKEKILKFYK